MQRLDPTAAALEVVASRFGDAAVTFLAGSVMLGEATPTSDLDLVVVHERLEAAYRESFVHGGWPVEAFVHDPETLQHFFGMDRTRGVLQHMVANGVPLPKETDLSRTLTALAVEAIRTGPQPWSDADIAASRYEITNLIDDIRSPHSNEELTATGAQLYETLAKHFLLTRGQWSATGKSIPRRLALADPAFAARFSAAFAHLFQESQSDAVISLSEEVLMPSGGWLFAGYKAVAPKDWRLSRASGPPAN